MKLRSFLIIAIGLLALEGVRPSFVRAQDPESTEQLYRLKEWKADESDRYVGDFVEERRIDNLRYPTTYTHERQLFQDQIVKKMVSFGSASESPRIIFMAGPYGAGKSTVLGLLGKSDYYSAADFARVDPDEIKEMIPEFETFKKKNLQMASTWVHAESTYIGDIALENLFANSKNIVVDTSLKNTEHFRDLIQYIRKVYPRYQIEIVGVKASRDRILEAFREREKKTGRIIPAAQKEESIAAGLKSVDELSSEVDRVLIVNNESKVPHIEQIHIRGKNWMRNIPFGHPLARANALSHFGVKATLPENLRVSDFDLDWTLFSPLFKKPAKMDWRVAYVQGQYYRFSDHGEVVLKQLATRSHSVVAFWSKGSRSRNLQLLKQITPPDWNGQSLYDIGVRIFSKEDLVMTANGPQKILQKVSKNPSNVILVDDQLENIRGSGSKGIFLGKTYNFYETEEELKEAWKLKVDDPRYIPSTVEEWKRDRNRMAGVYDILIRAERKSRGGTKSFADLVETQGVTNEMVERGLQRLKGISLMGRPKALICDYGTLRRIFGKAGNR